MAPSAGHLYGVQPKANNLDGSGNNGSGIPNDLRDTIEILKEWTQVLNVLVFVLVVCAFVIFFLQFLRLVSVVANHFIPPNEPSCSSLSYRSKKRHGHKHRTRSDRHGHTKWCKHRRHFTTSKSESAMKKNEKQQDVDSSGRLKATIPTLNMPSHTKNSVEKTTVARSAGPATSVPSATTAKSKKSQTTLSTASNKDSTASFGKKEILN